MITLDYLQDKTSELREYFSRFDKDFNAVKVDASATNKSITVVPKSPFCNCIYNHELILAWATLNYFVATFTVLGGQPCIRLMPFYRPESAN